jgi:hypothetical protein
MLAFASFCMIRCSFILMVEWTMNAGILGVNSSSANHDPSKPYYALISIICNSRYRQEGSRQEALYCPKVHYAADTEENRFTSP